MRFFLLLLGYLNLISIMSIFVIVDMLMSCDLQSQDMLIIHNFEGYVRLIRTL